MTLYVKAQTTIPDLIIDFIEIRLASGEMVSLNWDESEICRSNSGFSARYKGVCFGEEYANGKLDQLRDMVVTDIGLYSESQEFLSIFISAMEFVEGQDYLRFIPPTIVEEGCVTSG